MKAPYKEAKEAVNAIIIKIEALENKVFFFHVKIPTQKKIKIIAIHIIIVFLSLYKSSDKKQKIGSL